jgi:superoxide dismutase, Fe-Mn family
MGAHLFGGGLTWASSPNLPFVQSFPRKYEIKPLPFNSETLKGFSSKLILSHHENNYGGAVKNLMKVESEISKLSSDAPAFALTALKMNEHAFRNSMILHELYFENLGYSGKIQGRAEKLISTAWGSVSRFETEFKTAGAGVGGGTGWVIFGWDLRTSQPVLSVIGHNNQSPAWTLPLLLMDIYEHAYAIDFGAKLKDYIEAFFQNINWEIVNKRIESAQSVSKALMRG